MYISEKNKICKKNCINILYSSKSSRFLGEPASLEGLDWNPLDWTAKFEYKMQTDAKQHHSLMTFQIYFTLLQK